ncbi:hypothetical protein LRS06_20705 [Hymenobacter sp. J193]|uniref:hypothetical protein n=1 Tax=Hymenobacter sp. J193 TaxID=2898429 RepID=UPI002151A2EF|nr:hypothetical protein [Hymenobacter sp. J193]MCR5890151.1 hypothetical protein [Hymenobacter sp. J193]
MMHVAGWLRRALAVVAVAGVAYACDSETEEATPRGTDYYPVATGTYRIFEVEDVEWKDNQPTSTHSQFRERITDTFTDAAGLLSYRVIRSKRALVSDAWRDDSVYVLTPTSQTLQLSGQNMRTVELVFPVREGRRWNPYAFSDTDTLGRRYIDVNKPFTAGAKTYDETITTTDDGDDDAYYFSSRRQVFAKGVGPVFRERKRYFYCQNPNPDQGGCPVAAGYIQTGRERREVLLETGQL